MSECIPGVLQRITLAALALVCACAAPPTTTRSYRVETYAGTDNPGDGGAAIAAQLSAALSVAVDRDGNVYIADTDNHRLRKVTGGIIRTIAGNGLPGSRGDGGPAARAQFNQPYGVAVDGTGNVYVADLGNHRVRKIAPDGTITTAAGTGAKGSRGDNGPAAAADLMSPRNLAFDPAGNLYISEFDGHRIRKVSADGRISTVAGTGVAGMRGDGGQAARAQLNSPAAIATGPDGSLYIADTGNNVVRRVYPGGTIVTYIGGAPLPGMDPVLLYTPRALAVDASGSLYVADQVPRIRKFPQYGQPVSVAGTGNPGYDGDGRAASVSMLQSPADLTLDSSGNLFIADGRRVRKVESSGTFTTVAGDAYMKAIGDRGPATSAQLCRPMGLAIDGPGNLYIADSGTERIRKVGVNGIITTFAGNGYRGRVGDGMAGDAAEFASPSGVALDGAGNLLIADTGNGVIRQVSSQGLISTVAGSGSSTGLGADGMFDMLMPLMEPIAVAAGRAGDIFIADAIPSRVLLDATSGLVYTYAGNATAGFAGDGGNAALAQLHGPSGMALDGAGNLYIADTLNNRIRKVSPSGVIDTVAGNGGAGSGGDRGSAVAATLNRPCGVAVDGDGNLYIADTGNNAVRKVTPDGKIATIAGTGAAGYAGDGGPATAAALNAPSAVLVDGSGNIFVSDTGNNLVRRLVPLDEAPPPVVAVPQAAVVNSASLAGGPVAPGEIVSILGDGLGPEQGEEGAITGSGHVLTQWAGTQVFFDGEPAPLFYVSAERVNAQVPYGVAGKKTVQVEVRVGQEPRAQASVAVAESAPAIFTSDGGTGAAAVNQDGSLNAADNPAERGSIVTIFATGEGMTDPAGSTGTVARAPLPRPVLPVAVSVSGNTAEITYAGAAPGFTGLLQVNFRVPGGFVPTGAAPVQLTVGTAASQPGVTIAIR